MAELQGTLTDILELNGILGESVELSGELQAEGELIGNLSFDTLRGSSIQYIWDGTFLGIKTEDEDEYQFVDLGGTSPQVEVIQENEKTTINFIDINKTQTITIVNSDYLNDKVDKIEKDTTEYVNNTDTEIRGVKNSINSFSSITNMKIQEILNS